MTFNPGGSQPFNNSAAQPALVEMWRNNLRKSRVIAQQRDPTVTPPATNTQAVVNIVFDGGGQALVAGLGGLVEITFAARILGCHMYAGYVSLDGPAPWEATATVYLGLGAQAAWPAGSRPMYGDAMPSMTNVNEKILDVTTWTLDLQPGDLITYALTEVVGTATFLVVSLPLQRIDTTGIGLTPATDVAEEPFTNQAGQTFTLRNP